MEVIYEPPIMDRLRAVSHDAMAKNRVVHKVLLTKHEMNELLSWLATVHVVPSIGRPDKVLGMRIEEARE